MLSRYLRSVNVALEVTRKEIVVHADRGLHGARADSVGARSVPEIGSVVHVELGTNSRRHRCV